MPNNWKYIKKLLEKEFLCEKLKGHITYNLTNYRPEPWFQQHFIMKHDDEVLLDVAKRRFEWDNRYAAAQIHYVPSKSVCDKLRYKHNLDSYNIPEYELERFAADVMEEGFANIAHFQGIYGVKEIIECIVVYLHSSIEQSLNSHEYFIVALAVLDRRCGKRTLEKCASWEYTHFPEWLRRIYQIRFEAEGIRYSEHYSIQKSNKTI